MLSQSTHIKAAGSGARCRGGEKSHGTGTRTADTNYLLNWSKCSQKCHLLKDQLISSCCSPNNSREKKNIKILIVLRLRFFVSFEFWDLPVLCLVQLMRLWAIFISKTCWIPLKTWIYLENRHVTPSSCQIKMRTIADSQRLLDARAGRCFAASSHADLV